MKKLRIVYLFVLLVGCSSNQITGPTLIPTVPMPSSTKASTRVSPTETLITSETITPVEPTFPPGPTLTLEESRQEIAEMMQAEPDCLFPCWWGIIPGKTSWAYTSRLLTHMNLKSGSSKLPEGMMHTIVFAKDGDFTRAHVSFTVNNFLVDDIHVNGDETYDNDFEKRWEHHSFANILKIYGRPSQVWVVIIEDIVTFYHLLIFYDDLKALIIYQGASNSNHLCPDFSEGQIGWIDIYLQTPDKSRKLIDITDVKKTFEVLDQPNTHWVEKMTESRINEIYDLFTQNREPGCFEGIRK